MKRREFIQKCGLIVPMAFVGWPAFGQSKATSLLRRQSGDWQSQEIALLKPLEEIIDGYFQGVPVFLTGGCVLALANSRQPRFVNLIVDAGSQFSTIVRKLGRGDISAIPTSGAANKILISKQGVQIAIENVPLEVVRQRTMFAMHSNKLPFLYDALVYDYWKRALLDPLDAMENVITPASQATSLYQSFTVCLRGNLDVCRYGFGNANCLKKIEKESLSKIMADRESAAVVVDFVDALPQFEEMGETALPCTLMRSNLVSKAFESAIKVDVSKVLSVFDDAAANYGKEYTKSSILIALISVSENAGSIGLERCFARMVRCPSRRGAVIDGIKLAKNPEFSTRYKLI